MQPAIQREVSKYVNGDYAHNILAKANRELLDNVASWSSAAVLCGVSSTNPAMLCGAVNSRPLSSSE